MKRKIAVIALFVVAMLALSGCQCRHEWTEADCVTPRTCAKCGETEGEALGHDWQNATCAAPKTCARCGETEGKALAHSWKEANYQEPKTCTLCGATEGEPLTPYFVERGMPEPRKISSLGSSTPFRYVTSCYEDMSKKTVGVLRLSNYAVFDFDETHEGKEGYEWRAVQATIKFSDDNAYEYGFNFNWGVNDYYSKPEPDEEVKNYEVGTAMEYSVTYRGTEYPDCLLHATCYESGWIDGYYEYHYRLYFCVPVGYDGTVLHFRDSALTLEDVMDIYDVADENTLFFRMD